MTTTTASPSYYAELTLKTRKFGSCYVHAGNRSNFNHQEITFFVTGYGRSLESGGNKYKGSAYRNGKPVSSTELQAMVRA